jgi:hypothetical protein
LLCIALYAFLSPFLGKDLYQYIAVGVYSFLVRFHSSSQAWTESWSIFVYLFICAISSVPVELEKQHLRVQNKDAEIMLRSWRNTSEVQEHQFSQTSSIRPHCCYEPWPSIFAWFRLCTWSDV